MEYEVTGYLYTIVFLLTITSAKSTMETPIQGVKNAQSK